MKEFEEEFFVGREIVKKIGDYQYPIVFDHLSRLYYLFEPEEQIDTVIKRNKIFEYRDNTELNGLTAIDIYSLIKIFPFSEIPFQIPGTDIYEKVNFIKWSNLAWLKNSILKLGGEGDKSIMKYALIMLRYNNLTAAGGIIRTIKINENRLKKDLYFFQWKQSSNIAENLFQFLFIVPGHAVMNQPLLTETESELVVPSFLTYKDYSVYRNR